MFENILITVFSCLVVFSSPDLDGQHQPIDLQQVDDKDNVVIDADTTLEEKAQIIQGLRLVERQLSPKKEIRFPHGSLWDKKSSMDERLADLRERSILVNWQWWPADLTGNLNNDRQEPVRSAFLRRAYAQRKNFGTFEQAMSAAPPESEAQRVEKLLKELVDAEDKAERALVDELDEILLPGQLTEFVKGYMKRPSVSLLVSPLGKLYLDLSDAQFDEIKELHEKQANLLRLSNLSKDEQQVKYAKKQVPLLGIQIDAVLTEAQIKKHWDLLPGADPRLSFEEALAKTPAHWQGLYRDYVKARQNRLATR